MNPGAQTYQVTIHRDDPGQSWGFRMQGGADFSTPLSVQLVNPGSLAEQCNLLPGDAVLSINGKPSAELEHEKAKYEILMAQHDLNLVIQRGAVNIWKPKVTALSDIKPAELKKMGGLDEDVLIQRTSLAANKQDFNPVGSNYNRTARGFGGFGGGAPAAAPPPQQYAPPTQQPQAPPAQQYAGGASPYGGQQGGMQAAQQQMAGLSVRDQHDPLQRSSSPSHQAAARPHSPYRSASPSLLHVPQDGAQRQERSVSPTFLAVQEEESERQKQRVEVEPEPAKQSRSFRALEEGLTGGAGGGAMGGFRSVRAPITKAPSERPQQVHPVCAVCGGLCIGVFVKIHGEPIHPECFKCTRCGKNLKNQGHFTIEGKKYCDACATAVAAPPGPDMEAIPVYR